MKYSIEDIKIGDQVFFNSTDQQNNFDQYWTVTEKKGRHTYDRIKKFRASRGGNS